MWTESVGIVAAAALVDELHQKFRMPHESLASSQAASEHDYQLHSCSRESIVMMMASVGPCPASMMMHSSAPNMIISAKFC